MSRLLIDITEIVHWKGKLTGVPRVMNELSARFMNEDDVQFVSWNKRKQRLVSAQFIPADIALPDPVAVGVVNVPSKKERLLEGAKKLVRKSKYASRAVEIAKYVVKGTVSSGQELRRKQTTIVPTKDDTLFILADWHGSDPHYIDYVLRAKEAGTKLIQISYDLLPIVAPQYSGHSTKTFTRYARKIYPKCDLIISISKNTSNDIRSWLKKENARIPNIVEMRLGDDFRLTKSLKPTDKVFGKALKRNKQFLLCVGTVEARKNHTVLYYAYKIAAQKNIDLPPIVVVGRPGWLAHDIYNIISNDPETKDKFIFLKNATDNELAWLYKNCAFTVYPSFYEGWGLPVAESIGYGVPCLCSNTSSIPEIAGDTVDYFSPSSPEECLEAMVRLLKPAELAKAKKRVARYVPTAWDTTTNSVKQVIGDVYGKKN